MSHSTERMATILRQHYDRNECDCQPEDCDQPDYATHVAYMIERLSRG